MRITIRLIVSLVLAVAAVASFFAYVQVRHERDRLKEDLALRAAVLDENFRELASPFLNQRNRNELSRLIERFAKREYLVGVALYGIDGSLKIASRSLSSDLSSVPSSVQQALEKRLAIGDIEKLADKVMYISASPMGSPEQMSGVLVMVQDAGYVSARLSHIWTRNLMRLLIQMFVIALITLLVLRWSVESPIVRMAEWMKQLRDGHNVDSVKLPQEDLFAPIAREVTTLARHLSQAKLAAVEEARLRQISESLWTAEKLKEFIRNRFAGKPLVVISNREPYMHTYRGKQIESIIPAGGLVSALDPVLKATNGLWIAHGSGDADTDTADEQGRLRVPPSDPQYTLKRVFLTKEEENGYYYGFSNEGLWPLCHIAHTRPIFRPDDWKEYQKVNEKFAEAVLKEIHDLENPCVLVQDYHFALLPRLLKQKRPDARIGLFWHIPWPNSEAFGICPWRKELLFGMLGADLIGFHTQYHCNNFLETVDRTLESRIEWERNAVHKEGHTTLVNPFPISVDFNAQSHAPDPIMNKDALLKELGIKAEFMAVGVDRVDYTKGILERFQAVEHFLETYPQYIGRFTLVQLGAPSRTHILRYHDFLSEVEQEAERVNWKFKKRQWRPILFLKKHHNPEEIRPFYRAADLCLVTSLHDGMNLVAKEFVASRSDEDGVLILSTFAGAARELREALIVNPYDVRQTAQTIRLGLEMNIDERMDRMKRMRETIQEHNIYRWAGNLIVALTKIPSSNNSAARS